MLRPKETPRSQHEKTVATISALIARLQRLGRADRRVNKKAAPGFSPRTETRRSLMAA